MAVSKSDRKSPRRSGKISRKALVDDDAIIDQIKEISDKSDKPNKSRKSDRSDKSDSRGKSKRKPKRDEDDDSGPLNELEKLYKFTEKFRNPIKASLGPGVELTWTHAMTYEPKGSYNIPEDFNNAFMKLYEDAIVAGFEPHITESHKEFGPIVIDFDFVQDNEHPDRYYTETTIKNIINVYNSIIRKYLDVKSQQMCAYVTEKKAPTKRGGKVHDGIHIVYPHICTRPNIQMLMRNQFIKIAEKQKLFQAIPLTNSLQDVFDAKVINSVGWMLYGSRKNPDCDGYKLTHIYHTACRKIYDVIMPGQDLKDRELVAHLIRAMSCRKFDSDADITPFADGVDPKIIEDKIKRIADNIPVRDKKEIAALMGDNIAVVKAVSEKELAEARNLISLLSKERSDNYYNWYQVGNCCHNIDYRLLRDWIKFSKKSPKFKRGECEQLWRKMRPTNYTMATLHFFASYDNPKKYLRLKKEKLNKLIKDGMYPSHGAIAHLLMAKYQYMFKCASIKNQVWYEFKNHRWNEIDSAYSLRKLISEEVIDDYINQQSFLYEKAKQKQGYERDKIVNQANDIHLVIRKLNDSGFKNGVIRECADIAYDKDFLKNLDENNYLVGFENGVYDLVANVFRPGCPDDYISLCTGYNYIPYDENDEYSKQIDQFLKDIMPDDTMRDYLLTLLSTCLAGSISEQSFYVLTGSGANGKSKLMELMSYVLGDLFKPMDVRLITQARGNSSSASPELADKKGIRLCPFDEPKATDEINTAFMKNFSGGEKIMARALFKDPIYYKPQFKPMMLCNELPSIRGDDEGTWRRIKVIHFPCKFHKRSAVPRHIRKNGLGPLDRWANDDLSEKLLEWKEVFAAKLLARYQKYRKEGIKHPEQVCKATDAYRRKCDVYQDFIGDFMEKTDKDKDTISIANLHEGMRSWYRANFDGRCPPARELRAYLKSKMTDFFDAKRDVMTHHRIKQCGRGENDLDEIE